jgi:hypothetical protein
MIKPVGDWYLVSVSPGGSEATVLAIPETFRWIIWVGARVIIDPTHLKDSHTSGKFINGNYILGVIND